ncbi:MAG: Mur ligase family protein, partial [Candidatus Sumerlaeota bacterium]|nr:Mur ligase family protein [Candidatus Sumerlaeota bacterium]
MKLSDLLREAGIERYAAAADPEIRGVTDDSRQVQPGWLFVAVRGTHVDGLRFAPRAIQAGAAAVVAAQEAPADCQTPWIVAPDTPRALGQLAHAFAGRPSDSMTVVGVTGTNGKTTTAWLIESILRAAGHTTALLGTIHYRIGEETLPAPNTTASACQNAAMFARMRERGVDAVSLEVSSHAIDQRRIEGIRFRVGVLTNITQDHLDYHGTMEAYRAVKQRFFSESIAPTPGAVAVFNLDDESGRAFSDASPFGDDAASSARRFPNPVPAMPMNQGFSSP